MKGTKNKMMKKYVKANITWVICVLIFLLIVFITKDFSSESRLADMIGFGATLSSLILAILAIFQSIIYSAAAVKEKAESEAIN